MVSWTCWCLVFPLHMQHFKFIEQQLTKLPHVLAHLYWMFSLNLSNYQFSFIGDNLICLNTLCYVLRSCPELDKDSSGQPSLVTGFSDTHQFPQISKLGFPNTMDKTGISRSAHTIKVLVNFNSYFTSIYNDHLLAQARLQIQIWVGLCIFNFTFIESCQSKMRLGFSEHSLLTQFFIHQLL